MRLATVVSLLIICSAAIAQEPELLPPPSDQKPSMKTAEDDVRKAILKRCRSQMNEYGASLVKFCVDEDLKAYRALKTYDNKHKPIIDRCRRDMLSTGGWNLVKFCADEDIGAEQALEEY